MSQQPESGSYVLQNVDPFLQTNFHKVPNSCSEEAINEGSAHPQQLSVAEIAGYMFQQPESEVTHSSSSYHTMSQQPENGLDVQPNVSSFSQTNFDNMPKSSSEEAINGLDSNLGGSAHQQQLSNAQSIYNESIWTGERLNYYRPLYNAAQKGDWKKAKNFIDNDSNALTARITVHGETLLLIAAQSCQWGFILKLLELLSSPELTAVQDSSGFTALHYVAEGGSLQTAKALIKKNVNLTQIEGIDGKLPLLFSIYGGSKEMIWYLTSITNVESPSFPFFIPALPSILRVLIQSGFHDIALYFVQTYPYLALAKDDLGHYLLSTLACHPLYFFSGSKLGLFKRWIYKFVQVEEFPALVTSGTSATQAFEQFNRLLWKAIAQLVPFIKMVRDAKLKHECAVELVNHICTQLSSMNLRQVIDFLHDPSFIMAEASANGIEEIIKNLLEYFPDLMYYKITSHHNILEFAIEHRQEKIVNIIKGISRTTAMKLCSQLLVSGNITLHLVGKLAPASKLFSVSGAALQMQKELQWFKEVEKLTNPFVKGKRSYNEQTPEDVFRMEHKDLAAQGEKWMKDTANSCMLVSTLIATVLFAAAFTVPGGNVNDKGIPILLRTNAFSVFVISNALGLFSSLTSLLMFLAILTARYDIEDFLESLPKKLIIGLGSLFIAIVAMIVAFGATLTIVLRERWQWVSMPITLLASFPVAIFVMLQLPLFIQMVQSTYGSGMFLP